MGDLVVTTPILRALHEQLGAEVHLVTRAAFAPIVAHAPYVHQVHLWGDGAVGLLRAEAFDLVVDLHGSIRSHLLRMRLGVESIGFRKRNLEKTLLSRGIDLLGAEHLVDRYFGAVHTIGVTDDEAGLDYFTTKAELGRAGVLTEAFSEGYVAIVLGATHFTKRMSAELVAGILMGSPKPVVLLGGSDVVALAEEVLAKVTGQEAPRVLNLCNALELRDSIAVLAKAAAVVAGDTGLMHVSAALRRPMVVVWGNTSPAIGMYPRYPIHALGLYRNAEVLGLECRPCSRIGFPACPRGHFRCMLDQRADKIVAQLEEVLEAGALVGGATVDNRGET